MRKMWWMVWMAAFAALAMPVQAQWSNVGGGLAANVPGNDMDAAYGVYGSADFDVHSRVFVRLGLQYLSGDVTIDETDTSLTRTGAEVSVNVRQPMETFWLYGGVGAGFYLHDVDELSVDDKLGRFIQGGAMIPMTPRLNADVLVRFLQLKPDGPEFVEVNMDSFQLTAGLNYRF